MLLQFSAHNSFSMKDKVCLSLLASADKEHPSHLIEIKDLKQNCLKVSVIYGANASGKSNLINGFWYMVDFVLNSHEKQLGRPTGRTPFRFDQYRPQEPSSFEVIFIHEGIRYTYGFSATDTAVTEEYLYHYPKGRQAVIFERKNTDEYRFTADVDLQTSLKDRNSPNKLYLSTASNWNYDKVKPVFAWFAACKIICRFTAAKDISVNAEVMQNDEYRDRMAKLLQIADLGIRSLEPSRNRLRLDGSFKLDGSVKLNSGAMGIDAVHEVFNSEGQPVHYNLNMRDESEGTNRYFRLIGTVQKALEQGGLLVADEMDVHLHPLLIRHIISLFHSAENNPYGAQLIFTTHNTNLLDLDIFRRDQIWFTEKNERTAATELFSLDDFSIRKDNKVERSYLLGKFGAVPFIKGGME